MSRYFFTQVFSAYHALSAAHTAPGSVVTPALAAWDYVLNSTLAACVQELESPGWAPSAAAQTGGPPPRGVAAAALVPLCTCVELMETTGHGGELLDKAMPTFTRALFALDRAAALVDGPVLALQQAQSVVRVTRYDTPHPMGSRANHSHTFAFPATADVRVVFDPRSVIRPGTDEFLFKYVAEARVLRCLVPP